ncbi:MAG: ABC transporter permease [endosymbiont of Seepiophila jonesi]|uniref:ABC transporter permease n=1 Tax=endosymbiont of Lamellibrachia luymesi TaxID=2200907 RepID=A0A370DV94_9GAMM|nr:MAG: ABC transporter permease [endosymbiont of Lamellibrachia luymesi]RDH94326.1 MAG: ABC transporter permease [endosymbiont of Seepiophila jonesi]
MPDNRPVFHILAVGWDHPAWQGSFYPDDLPEDWRLTYYANEVPGVLVPMALWCKADEAQVESWIDDVEEGFRFYLALTGGGGDCDPVAVADLLGDNLGGVVVDSVVETTRTGEIPRFTLATKGQQLSEKVSPAYRLTAESLGDLRAQRALLESLAGQVPEGADVLLFIEGERIDMAVLKDLRQLAQLLGLA